MGVTTSILGRCQSPTP